MFDEPLREALDPSTPGERLEKIWRDTFRSGGMRPGTLALRKTILVNPNLPLPLVRQLLLDSEKPSSGPAIWYNPTVPLLLVLEPRPEFREAAARVLGHKMIGLRRASLSLDELVAHWWRFSRIHPEQVQAGEAAATLALARHLAGLFGLPWT